MIFSEPSYISDQKIMNNPLTTLLVRTHMYTNWNLCIMLYFPSSIETINFDHIDKKEKKDKVAAKDYFALQSGDTLTNLKKCRHLQIWSSQKMTKIPPSKFSIVKIFFNGSKRHVGKSLKSNNPKNETSRHGGKWHIKEVKWWDELIFVRDLLTPYTK